jgi:hypothetical protein
MQMTYALERRAGQWTVLNSRPVGGQHPSMENPQGSGTDSSTAMPRFHVPADTPPKPAKP